MTADAGAPDPMGADPNMGAGIGNVAADPNAGMPAEGDPAMGDGAGMEGEEGGSDFSSKYNELSKEDQIAVDHYMDSLFRRDETLNQDAGMDGMEEPAPAPAPEQAGQGVMMEITKGRLKKVQQRLHETFRSQKDDADKTERPQKKVNKNRRRSPFDCPLE